MQNRVKHFDEAVNDYKYFRKLWLFLQYKLTGFSTSWNKYHDFFLIQVYVLL